MQQYIVFIAGGTVLALMRGHARSIQGSAWAMRRSCIPTEQHCIAASLLGRLHRGTVSFEFRNRCVPGPFLNQEQIDKLLA
jgi:hypothetical protein